MVGNPENAGLQSLEMMRQVGLAVMISRLSGQRRLGMTLRGQSGELFASLEYSQLRFQRDEDAKLSPIIERS
jgi:hypothetical protein